MSKWFSTLLDKLSGYLAPRKGLLPITGIGLILLNFVFQVVGSGWLADTNFFLHIGIIVAIFGFMVAWAL